MRLVLAIAASLLPARRRRELGLPLVAGTMAGGALELLCALLVGAHVFARYQRTALAGAEGENAKMFVHGASAFFVFITMTPTGLGCVLLVCEGLVRIASAIAGEPLGSIAAWSVDSIARAAAARMGSVVATGSESGGTARC